MPDPEKVVIGDATLYCGDMRDILPLLDPFDLIITDPPYGIKLSGRPTNFQRMRVVKKKDWDNSRPDPSVFDMIMQKSRASIIWGGNYYNLPISRGWLCWKKRNLAPSFADFELAWTSYDMNSRMIETTIHPSSDERTGHPTQKPLKVMEWCLSFSRNVSTVCDPFMGSGTTGVACRRHGLSFTGIELDRQYFDIAVNRIARAHAQGKLFNDEKQSFPIIQEELI